MNPEPAWRKPDNTNENPERLLAESRNVIDVDLIRSLVADLDLDLEHVVRLDLRNDRMEVDVIIPGHGKVLNTYFYTEPI